MSLEGIDRPSGLTTPPQPGEAKVVRSLLFLLDR